MRIGSKIDKLRTHERGSENGLRVSVATLCFLALVSYASASDQRGTQAITAGEDRYKLVMSKDDKLCNYMREVLNKDLEKYGRGDSQRKFRHPVFSSIQWKNHGRYEGDNSYNYGGVYTQIDIDNDNQTETVIRKNWSRFKGTFDVLFILSQNQQRDHYKQYNHLKRDAKGGISIGRSGYDFMLLPPKTFREGVLKGRKYYEGLSEYVEIYPFIFNKRYYVLIKNNSAVRNFLRGDAKVLIARYIKGFVQSADSEKLHELCYLRGATSKQETADSAK